MRKQSRGQFCKDFYNRNLSWVCDKLGRKCIIICCAAHDQARGQGQYSKHFILFVTKKLSELARGLHYIIFARDKHYGLLRPFESKVL